MRPAGSAAKEKSSFDQQATDDLPGASRRALKVAEHATCYYQRGKLIWDDFLYHRQFELTGTAQGICRRFATFATPRAVLDGLGGKESAVLSDMIDELVAAGVLIEEGSPEHHAEQRLLAAWSDWGRAVSHYHFASRTLRDTPYVSVTEQDAELDRKLATDPPPAPFRQLGGAHRIELPPLDDAISLAPWASRPLLDVLLDRKTTRDFGSGPVPAAELGQFLGILAGPSPSRPSSSAAGTVFKTSPSAGARHPVELYLHVQRAVGVPVGWYHYAAGDHALEFLADPWSTADIARMAGDQEWVGAAPVVVCYTAMLDRTRWKYDTARTYRMVQMDVGHLSQTAYLVATAMGLGVGFSAALRDELIERALCCDPNHEIVLGLTALGPLA